MRNERFGKLEVICGSMFSGKSEELLFRLRRAEYAKKKVLTIKHAIDKRTSFTCVGSHNGEKREAHPIRGCQDSLQTLIQLADDSVEVVGIDEIQFFPEETVGVIQHLVDLGKRIIVAGLDLDFRRIPFGIVPQLMAHADEVTKLRAICVQCGNESNYSQRLIDGGDAGERSV